MSKFESAIDEFVYHLTVNGWTDDEIGSVDELGYHAKLDWTDKKWSIDELEQHTPAYITLDAEDIEFLTTKAIGAIFCEDNQGFVDVEFFVDAEKLNAAWDTIIEDYEEYYAD